MNKLYYILNCPLCKEDGLGVIFANNSLDVNEKIIIVDPKLDPREDRHINRIYGKAVTPTLIVSRKGIVKDKFNRTVVGNETTVLKVSCLDWVHTQAFVKALKGVL
ncbi:MAG: hypothetical protein ACTSV7_00835 [Candidatus Baldrarchaeia archaeon]